MESMNQPVDKFLILLQECAIVTFARYALRTAEVQIDGVTVGRDHLRGMEQVVGIVGAELDEQRTVELRVPI